MLEIRATVIDWVNMNHMKYREDKHGALHLRNDPEQQHRQRSDWLWHTLNILTEYTLMERSRVWGGTANCARARVCPCSNKGEPCPGLHQ